MPIIAREPESTFVPCPEGLHQAVCVDVVDLGVVTTQYGEKHQVRIVWQVDEENPENDKRYTARRSYTLSLSKKANLRTMLETWRTKPFTDDELKGFDLENLLGINCQIQVVHKLSAQGKLYANVQAVVAPPKNVPKLLARDYTREKDREQPTNGGGPVRLEDIPFIWLLPIIGALCLRVFV